MNNIKIINKIDNLTNTEQYLVDFINKNPKVFVHQTSGQIAKQANVSPSALTRLTKKLGFDNLKALQMMVASKTQEFQKPTLFQNDEWFIITEALEKIDLNAFDQLTNEILQAKKIFLFENEINNLATTSLAFNLEKIGIKVITNKNFNAQLLALSTLNQNDLIIIFASTFFNKETFFLIKKVVEWNLPLTIISNQKNLWAHKKTINWLSLPPLNLENEINKQLFQLTIVNLIYYKLLEKLSPNQKTSLIKNNNLLAEWQKANR